MARYVPGATAGDDHAAGKARRQDTGASCSSARGIGPDDRYRDAFQKWGSLRPVPPELGCPLRRQREQLGYQDAGEIRGP